MARAKSLNTKYFGYLDPIYGLNKHVFALVKDISTRQQVRFSAQMQWSNYQISLVDMAAAFDEFSSLTGIPLASVSFNLEGERDWDNISEGIITFVGVRLENDEELDTRLKLEENKARVAKEAAKKAKKTREENEKKEYERLKAKFEKE